MFEHRQIRNRKSQHVTLFVWWYFCHTHILDDTAAKHHRSSSMSAKGGKANAWVFSTTQVADAQSSRQLYLP